MGSSRAATSKIPFERGKLRRAKSQERRRHEIRLARARGEQTVKRVAKPGRRNAAGEANPRRVDPRALNVLKGAEAHERSQSHCPGNGAG